jgi:hypothetical protein
MKSGIAYANTDYSRYYFDTINTCSGQNHSVDYFINEIIVCLPCNQRCMQIIKEYLVNAL